MQNSPLFLLDPTGGHTFARIEVTDTTGTRLAIQAACAIHFGKPVRFVSALYLETFKTLKILFQDGSDLFLDVDYDEPDGDDETPF